MYIPGIHRSILTLVIMVVASVSGYAEAQSSFTIVENGQAACVIVTAPNPGPSARLGALEIQTHIRKITGVTLPVHTSEDPVNGLRILVGDSVATRALGFDTSQFASQEYLIAFRPKTLVLLGHDWVDTPENRNEPGRTTTNETLAGLRHCINYGEATGGTPDAEMLELPGLLDEQATCYAVYDFLERFCGVRWYGPSELNQIIPTSSELIIQGTDIRRAPAAKHRDAMMNGSWPFLRGQWGDYSRCQMVLYWRRMRLGGEKWAGNHTIHRQTIKHTLNDPAYQAQGSAKGMNLCYTHPEAVQAVARVARDFFDGKGELPQGFKGMGDYFALVPEDVGAFCNCDACSALLESGKAMNTGHFSSGHVSNYWFSFVNAVARDIRRTHPDKYIATLGYWGYAYPPSIPLEKNVSVSPCLHTCYYANNAAVRENDMALYRAWRDYHDGPMFMWTYYHHPMESALIGDWKCFPNFMPRKSADIMRGFMQDGVQGFFQCGEQDQLEQYIIAKIWDDPGQDADALMDEFFRLYFGPAGDTMKAFYCSIEEIACNPAHYPAEGNSPSEIRSWQYLGTEARMQKLGELMARAQTQAASGPEQQRVALWHDAIWTWMQEGRAAYLEKNAAAQ